MADVDDALVVATDRTTRAQTRVGDVVQEGVVPPAALVDDVVVKAEDVVGLTGEARDARNREG